MKTSAPPIPQTVDPNRRYTYPELCKAVGEIRQPHELWDGMLVMEAAPGYGHQEIVGRLYFALFGYAKQHRLGRVVLSPVDLVVAPKTCVQPDLIFISKDNPVHIARAIEGPVDFAVEVLSPWQRRKERTRKRDLYEKFGIREYWIIDPKRRSIEALDLRPDGRYGEPRLYGETSHAESAVIAGFRTGVKHLLDGD